VHGTHPLSYLILRTITRSHVADRREFNRIIFEGKFELVRASDKKKNA
jgi:hypothetical protein